MDSDEDTITVRIETSKTAYKKAKALAENNDPRTSILGEHAGMLDYEELLGWRLQIHLEEMDKTATDQL